MKYSRASCRSSMPNPGASRTGMRQSFTSGSMGFSATPRPWRRSCVPQTGRQCYKYPAEECSLIWPRADHGIRPDRTTFRRLQSAPRSATRVAEIHGRRWVDRLLDIGDVELINLATELDRVATAQVQHEPDIRSNGLAHTTDHLHCGSQCLRIVRPPWQGEATSH